MINNYYNIPVPECIKLLLLEVVGESVEHIFKLNFSNECLVSSRGR